MSKTTQYDLMREADQLVNAVLYAEGEVDEEVAAAIEEWAGDVDTKIRGWIAYRSRVHQELDAIDVEMSALRAAKKKMDREVLRARDAVGELLEAKEQLGEEPRVRWAGHTVTLLKRPAQELVVPTTKEEILDLPQHCRKVRHEPNKRVIRQMLEDGDHIDGCHLVARPQWRLVRARKPKEKL